MNSRSELERKQILLKAARIINNKEMKKKGSIFIHMYKELNCYRLCRFFQKFCRETKKISKPSFVITRHHKKETVKYRVNSNNFLTSLRMIRKLDNLWSSDILCISMDCPWTSPGQNTSEDGLSLLQGIFPTQGLNPGLPALQADS